MKYRLIAFDLDGTFLRNDKSIPQENMEAIEKAASMGATVVPSSGRILAGLPKELMNASFIRYYIVGNGAAIYDKSEDRVISKAEIDYELALRSMKYLENADSTLDCYQDDWGYMNEDTYYTLEDWIPDPAVLKHTLEVRSPVKDLISFVKEKGRSVQKIQMYFRNMDERERLMKTVPQLFPELITSSSIYNNIEINSRFATKGQALARLSSILNIGIDETAAMGDGSNDMDMIRTAGMGIAMANSSEAVLRAADFVTKSNMENGAAWAIEKILKNEL